MNAEDDKLIDDQMQTIRTLRTEGDKLKAMVIEFINMTGQPLEYRRNSVKRAQALLNTVSGKRD